MSLVGPNAPLSPVSLGGSEWSVGKYQGPDDGPYPNNRSNLASPPISGGSHDAVSMNGFPAPRSTTGGPSPPPSVGARSSSGTNIFPRTDSARNSTRGGDMDDAVLGEHYRTLRTFLQSRDPNAKPQPNKARDKLLRLSSVQFFELSTDVYDELIRRQAAARAPPNIPNGPPAFLLAEKNFHPKRNQARQRLSSLGPPRFRDLAADVFHELERRFPRFAGGDIPRGGSAMSNRSGPGGPFPPRGPAMRRPSDASSIRGPAPYDAYGIPPSPGLPPGDFGRPMPRQLNQNNTIVPNKSTMVEEDDDGADEEGSDALVDRESKRSAGSGVASETDKKLIEDYQSQVRELREKLDGMEDAMKKKEDEMNSALETERSALTVANTEKQEWDQLRRSLEDKLSEAQNLNDSMKQELERMRDDHDEETRQLQDQVQEMQINVANVSSRNADPELERENEELRNSLEEQQRISDQVRQEAQNFLQEMRTLSQQSTTTYERQLELEKTVEELEREVREWRNRYARTKTQLRDLRGSSFESTTMEKNAAQYLRDNGFVEDTGLIKDVHVTKFQISIDQLLQTARNDDARKVMDAMKLVVVSVRRITKDLDEATPQDDELSQRQAKLRAKVSATANGLITATKHFASGAGMFPVSLLDAAASHLSAAVIELLRLAKIRITPAAELEQDEEEEVMSPVGSATGFFSPKHTNRNSISSEALPPPPPFQGLGAFRASADSSAYSPVNSPRGSLEPKPLGTNGMTNGMTNGNGYNYPPPLANTNGYGTQSRDVQAENLRLYVNDQAALLVSDIQNLVGLIRSDADIDQISHEIGSINAIVGSIIAETQHSGNANMVARLDECRERLLEASDRGRQMASAGASPADRDWRMWSQTLPPIAFEINREIKELAQRLDRLVSPSAADEFS